MKCATLYKCRTLFLMEKLPWILGYTNFPKICCLSYIRNIQGFFVFHHEKTVTCTSSKSIFQCLWHSATIGRNESRKYNQWLQYKLLMTLQIMQIYDICSECVRKTMRQNLLWPMLTLLLQRHLLSPHSELKLDQAGVPRSINYVPRCLFQECIEVDVQ
jgi:hypothetical protein